VPFWIPDLVTPSIGTFDPTGAGILPVLIPTQVFYNRHIKIIFPRLPMFVNFFGSLKHSVCLRIPKTILMPSK
jgi:hypothetical protein